MYIQTPTHIDILQDPSWITKIKSELERLKNRLNLHKGGSSDEAVCCAEDQLAPVGLVIGFGIITFITLIAVGYTAEDAGQLILNHTESYIQGRETGESFIEFIDALVAVHEFN